MNQLVTFLKKEYFEQLKNHKCLVLIILFCIVGIISPAIAKLMPWLFEMFLTDSGIIVENYQVDALTSWSQYFKNMQLILVIFVVMFSSILISEKQKGTLIILLSKGLKRKNVIISKTIILFIFWTIGYLLSLLITYGYTTYFFDSHIINSLSFTIFCFYLFGLYLCSLIILSSVFCNSVPAVIISIGIIFFTCYLLALIPALTTYFPTALINYTNLLSNINVIDYLPVTIITSILTVLNLAGAIIGFKKSIL